MNEWVGVTLSRDLGKWAPDPIRAETRFSPRHPFLASFLLMMTSD